MGFWLIGTKQWLWRRFLLLSCLRNRTNLRFGGLGVRFYFLFCQWLFDFWSFIHFQMISPELEAYLHTLFTEQGQNFNPLRCCSSLSCFGRASNTKVLKGTSYYRSDFTSEGFHTWRLAGLENGCTKDSLWCVQVGWGHMRSSLFWWVSPSCSLNMIHAPVNKKNSSWWIFPVVHLLFQHWIQRQLLGCFPSLLLFQIVFAWSANMWGRC